MNRRDVLRTLQNETSEAVKDCAESVKSDNPDLDKDQAFAICQSMENEGQLSDVNLSAELQEDDPCWDNFVMVGTKTKNGQEVPNCVPEEDADPANLADGCPEGEFMVDGECKSVEDTGKLEPPQLSGWTRQLNSLETEPIEREEVDEDEVRYNSVTLLAEGVWTDQASKTPTLYSESGMQNFEPDYDSSEFDGPPLNIMHDVNMESGEVNDASVAGHVDPNSLRVMDGRLVGDLVINRDSGAGQFADENLQTALKSEGTEGFGGPSVELDFENPQEDIKFNAEKDVEEVQRALFKGVGLVMQPASKSVDFSREAARRPVALSDSSQTIKTLKKGHRYMANAEEMRETLETFGFDTGGMDDEDVMSMAEDLHDELMDEMQEMEDMDEEDDEEEKENAEHGDKEDEDEEEEDGMDMADAESKLQNLEERMANLEDTMDQMMSESEMQETLSDELEETKEELAAAETVSELQDAKDDLEKRLSNLEDEPTDPKTLSDADSTTDTDDDSNITPVNPRSGPF